MTGMVQGKISGNLMSLGAIDFGLIIDGAVVIVENIVRQSWQEKQRHLGRTLTKEERAQTVLAGSKQMAGPTFFGVLIIGMVYLPIMSLTGIEGKMFHPMAVTVMLALGGALALTLTFMPVRVMFVRVAGATSARAKTSSCALQRKLYAPALDVALRFRWFVVGVAGLVLALSAFVFNRLGAEFVPQLDEGSLGLFENRPSGQHFAGSVA